MAELDEHITAGLRRSLDEKLVEAGAPPLDWCPVCGGTDSEDHVCPSSPAEPRGIVNPRDAEYRPGVPW